MAERIGAGNQAGFFFGRFPAGLLKVSPRVAAGDGTQPVAKATIGSEAVEALQQDAKRDLDDVRRIGFVESIRAGDGKNEPAVASHDLVPGSGLAGAAAGQQCRVVGHQLGSRIGDSEREIGHRETPRGRRRDVDDKRLDPKVSCFYVIANNWMLILGNDAASGK